MGTIHAGDRLCAEADGIFILVDHSKFFAHTDDARRERERVSRVDLEGLCNFRDLGGYPDDRRSRGTPRSPLPQRRVAPHDPGDVDTVCLLEIATVIDLRARPTRSRTSAPASSTASARRTATSRRGLPCSPRPPTTGRRIPAAEHYFGYLGEGRTCFGGVVETLADPDRVPRCSSATRARTAPGPWPRWCSACSVSTTRPSPPTTRAPRRCSGRSVPRRAATTRPT